jgi:EAL domain-containing protein (putative c-di-GMP-specific phosphodiesterase class I)
MDRVFVNGVASMKKGAVVEANIAMAKTLGLDSVAEGVETAEDWECLHARDATWLKGFSSRSH